MKLSTSLRVSAAIAAVFASYPAAAQEYFARQKLEVVSGPQGPAADWETGSWSNWSSTCSNSAVRTRTVLCKKGSDLVPDTSCAMFDRPPTNDVQSITSGCSYAWDARPSAWSEACGAGSTRTTTHVCERSDGNVAADNLCSGAKPEPITETRTSYAGCKARDWAVGEWVESSYCTYPQSKVGAKRTMTCMNNGQPAADAFCSGLAKPDVVGDLPCVATQRCTTGGTARLRMTSPHRISLGQRMTTDIQPGTNTVTFNICHRSGTPLSHCSSEVEQVGSQYRVTVYGIPVGSPAPTTVSSTNIREYVYPCTR